MFQFNKYLSSQLYSSLILPPSPTIQYVGVPPPPAYVSQQHGQFVNQYQHDIHEMGQQMELMKMENHYQLEMLKMQNQIIIEKLNKQVFLQMGMQQYRPPTCPSDDAP